MERRLLDQDEAAVTVLRPGAVHGPHSRHAREWFGSAQILVDT